MNSKTVYFPILNIIRPKYIQFATLTTLIKQPGLIALQATDPYYNSAQTYRIAHTKSDYLCVLKDSLLNVEKGISVKVLIMEYKYQNASLDK